MSIVCWQTILMKYQTLFFLKIMGNVAKLVVCCSRDWPLRVKRFGHFEVLWFNEMARRHYLLLIFYLLYFQDIYPLSLK